MSKGPYKEIVDACARNGNGWTPEHVTDWFSLPMTFSCTGLCFSGAGGQTITSSDTTYIIVGEYVYIYVSGRFYLRRELNDVKSAWLNITANADAIFNGGSLTKGKKK